MQGIRIADSGLPPLGSTPAPAAPARTRQRALGRDGTDVGTRRAVKAASEAGARLGLEGPFVKTLASLTMDAYPPTAGPSRYTATVGPDFRTEPMESREGEGRAKKAYERVPGDTKYSNIQRLPILGNIALRTTEEMLGFWMLWHLHGGFDGLERWGMNRATIFRKVGRFRQIFGEHPDTFEMPGITLDVQTYWDGAAEAAGRMSKNRSELKARDREAKNHS